MINLSASSIKDYLACPARFNFRTTASGQGVQTKEQLEGEIVHATVEKYWNDPEIGFQYAQQSADEHELVTTKINKCLKNFYSSFPSMLTEQDEVEKFFKVKYPTYTMVGRMDRISNGTIFDWKTSEKMAYSINNDVQFIIYYMSYKKLYKKRPVGIFYANLYHNEILNFTPNQSLIDLLYGEIIPEILTSVKGKQFPKTGLFEPYKCIHCNFRDACYKETQ